MRVCSVQEWNGMEWNGMEGQLDFDPIELMLA
jgi:hypothetical protein